MSDTIWGVLLGGGLALLGTVVTLWIQSRQQSVSNARWYAEFFYKDQLDTLRDLYATLVDLREAVLPYANPLITPEQSQAFEVSSKHKAVSHQLALSYPYLYSDTYAQLVNAQTFLMAFWLRQTTPPQTPAPNPGIPVELEQLTWDMVDLEYNMAAKALLPFINPNVLHKLSKLM
jgi:hypothetical protein